MSGHRPYRQASQVQAPIGGQVRSTKGRMINIEHLEAHGVHPRCLRKKSTETRSLPQMHDGLADGDGDETLAIGWSDGRGAGWILMVPRARLRCCLGARPVVLSVAVPYRDEHVGENCVAPRFAATAIRS